MAVIALEGMEFYAHHGYYAEERIIGGEYVVDVYITTQTTKAVITDKLEETINYESVYLLCRSVMKHPYKLIETVAEHIALGLKHLFRNMSEVKVRVRKKNPPLGGPVASAYVEASGEFSKNCGRCGRPLLCYGDKTCWCMDTLVYQRTLEHVKAQYGNKCLCKQCLDYFAAD